MRKTKPGDISKTLNMSQDGILTKSLTNPQEGRKWKQEQRMEETEKDKEKDVDFNSIISVIDVNSLKLIDLKDKTCQSG